VAVTVAADFSKATFSPVSFAEVGHHTVSIDIVDTANGILQKFFTVRVINEAPFFTNLPWPMYSVALNEVKQIEIIDVDDKEFNPITMTFSEIINE